MTHSRERDLEGIDPAGLHPAAHAAERSRIAWRWSCPAAARPAPTASSTRRRPVSRWCCAIGACGRATTWRCCSTTSPSSSRSSGPACAAGLYVTPINWHLAAAEAGYIVEDCGADRPGGLGPARRRGARARRRPGERHHSARGRRRARRASSPTRRSCRGGSSTPVPEECEGSWMFYSSGTTGRPKGIVPPAIGGPLGAPSPFATLVHGAVRVHATTPCTSARRRCTTPRPPAGRRRRSASAAPPW